MNSINLIRYSFTLLVCMVVFTAIALRFLYIRFSDQQLILIFSIDPFSYSMDDRLTHPPLEEAQLMRVLLPTDFFFIISAIGITDP